MSETRSSRLKDVVEDVDPQSFMQLLMKSLKRTYDIYAGNFGLKPRDFPEATKSKLRIKLLDEYDNLDTIPIQGSLNSSHKLDRNQLHDELLNNGKFSDIVTDDSSIKKGSAPGRSTLTQMIDSVSAEQGLSIASKSQDSLRDSSNTSLVGTSNLPITLRGQQDAGLKYSNTELADLQLRALPNIPKPKWHAPWKLFRVISGHQGWVQCLTVDPTNEWFASGGNDRLIKIWDLASGALKLSLTGHINTVRDIAISARHPYLFSCGEDNRVKCWDLEQNKVVRDYHGHLSGVYCITLHPGLDILASGGRDAAVRVWDMRTKQAIHVLSGHSGTIMSLQSQNIEPQLISGSQDKMVRLWDLAAGKCNVVLTNHKKSVRAMAIHPKEYTFCSCAADNIKVWQGSLGQFSRNIQGHNSILNCCAIKEEAESSILVAGSNNGQLHFWDWQSGYKFDTIQSRVQPGSLESENCIFACVFDKSETRLITGECDKTIKIWKENEDATPESHPCVWKPPREVRKY